VSVQYEVIWTGSAQNDLNSIIEYIADDNVSIAQKTFNNIRSQCLDLEKFPKRGRIVPELNKFNIKNYREIIISPWRIVYRIDDLTVIILAVFDGRRNMEDILLNRILSNT
jgi:addiction module RelE/StbE family toxin